MNSPSYDSDEDEELGALIYQSSQMAKRAIARSNVNVDVGDVDEYEGEASDIEFECDKPVLEAKNNEVVDIDNDEKHAMEQYTRAPFSLSQQTLRRSTRARRSTATATAGETRGVSNHNHDLLIEQKQQHQQTQSSLVGNGDRNIARRSSRKRSPTAHLLHSAETCEEVQLKLSEGNSKTKIMAGPAPKKRKRQIKRLCSAEGCTHVSQLGGLCSKHGGGRRTCSAEGCTNCVVQNGVCIKHGAQRKQIQRKCSADGCTRSVWNGVCVSHGGTRKCSIEGCTKHAVQGRVCIRHGAQAAVRKFCSHPGCTNKFIRKGVCARHGARRHRCSRAGCTSGAVSGGVCVKHGAKIKMRPCSHEGCKSWARMGGKCNRHGAKMKRCGHKGCSANAKKGGMCNRHGAM